MTSTNILTDVSLGNSRLNLGDSQDAFPAKKKLGDFTIVDGIPYMYSVVEGLETWYPMASRRDTHIHVQGLPSVQWTVNHDLGSKDLIFVVYDKNRNVMMPGKFAFPSDNQMIISFSEAVIGRIVVFAPSTSEGKAGSPAPEVKYTTLTHANELKVVNGDVKWFPPREIYISGSDCFVSEVSEGDNIDLVLRKNDIPVLNITLPMGQHTVEKGGFNPIVVSPGDYLTVDVTKVGSTTPGSNLVARFHYT